MTIEDAFPLAHWFDITQPIEKGDADKAEAQMGLYASREGLDPNCRGVWEECAKMRRAVAQHNKQFADRTK